MAADTLTIAVQRNEDYHEVWTITDGVPVPDHPSGDPIYQIGTPIDLTGYTVKGGVAFAAGAAPILPLPTKTDYALSGIKFETPRTSGEITVTIRRAELKAAVGATNNAQGTVNLAYDIVLTDPAGINRVLMRGVLTYEPEITT